MAKITETRTTKREVKDTEEIAYVQCDVCGDTWEEDSDEMLVHDFAVDPSYSKKSYRFNDLQDIIKSYHVKQPKMHGIEQYEDGKFIQVPHEDLIHCIRQEIKLMARGRTTSLHQLAGEVRDTPVSSHGLNNDVVYVWQDEMHHFAYELNVDGASDDHKHVCDDCYEVVFDGGE